MKIFCNDDNNDNNKKEPTKNGVITLFSAPNYCDVYRNKGACLKINGTNLDVSQWKHSPHPYVLPHFMNAIAVSLPFVIATVSKLLYDVLSYDENTEYFHFRFES